MKIKDLPSDANLKNFVFIHPETGERCVMLAFWSRGVWFKREIDFDKENIEPLVLEDALEIKEFEVFPRTP